MLQKTVIKIGLYALISLAALLFVSHLRGSVNEQRSRADAAEQRLAAVESELTAETAAFAKYREEAVRQAKATEAANAKREAESRRLAAATKRFAAYSGSLRIPSSMLGQADSKAAIEAGCDCELLPGRLRVLHDAAAAACDPSAASGLDAGRDAPPIDIAELAETVTENYCRAEANRQQVIRLQALIATLRGAAP